jgi:AraC-like DNA-binding protein
MAVSERDPVGVLYLSTGLVLLLGRYINTAPHRHFTGAVTVSLEGPIRYRTIDSGRWIETRGMVARPNACFELDTGDALVMNFQIDPEKADVAALDALPFGMYEVMALPDHVLDPLIDTLRAMAHSPRVNGHAMRNATLHAICQEPRKPRSFDPRIARVLLLLKQTFPDAPTSGELAAQVGLSEGRLIHLFGEQLGVPLRRYVLALRLRHVLFGLAMGHNLTDSAHEAGFCDSAHFTRVYREMYGMPPSKILRSDSVRIRFQAPDNGAPTSPHAEQDRPLLQRIEQSRVSRVARISRFSPNASPNGPANASSRVERRGAH